jgi:hypothetical protein
MNLGIKGRVGIVASLLAAIWGCSDMAPEGDTYQTVYGRLNPTGGAGGDAQDGPPLTDSPEWACLGKPYPMAARTANSSRIKYQVIIVDFDTNRPIPDLVVQACTTGDCAEYPACDPASTPTPTTQCATVTYPAAGAAPVFVIDLPYGFDGGLKLTADPAQYVEMDYFFGGPMIGLPELAPENGGATVVGLPIPVIKQTTRDRVYRDVRLPTVDKTRGVVAVRTLNCLRRAANAPDTTPPQGQRAAGITLESVPDAPDGAVAWTLSNLNIFTPNRLETDARGVAGLLNAPASALDVVAALPDGTRYGDTTTKVGADKIILLELRPGSGLGGWGQ